MNPFDPGTLSEEEVRELLAVDGDTPADGHTPPEMQRRLSQDLAFARRLRRVLRPNDSGLDTATRDPAGATAREGPPAAPATLGRFEIRRELGRGGFGVVFLAFDPLLNREVAVKVPRAQVLVTPELRERFHREARAAAGLEHPNLVPVYEAGEVGEICFLVSAYCPGTSLDRWLRQHREPVPFGQAAALVATLAGAMQHAHERGVVHRDLKPANILLSLSGEPQASAGADACDAPLGELTPKITDFGLAKLADSAAAPTQSGVIVGTASYMAPEQAGGKNKEVGPPADIYALGVVLYELLTGRTPFQGDSDLDILLHVRIEEPVPPSRLRPKVPRDLETICLKCLQKEPRRRYVSSAALADDLRRFQGGLPILARPVGVAERLGRWCRRNPALASAGGLVAVSLLAVVGLSLGFALYQAHAAENLREEQRRTQSALEDMRRVSTLLSLDRGLTLCEQGKVGRGMLWLARSLETAPDERVDLRRTIRANLASWYGRLRPRLRTILAHSDGCRIAAFSPDGRILVTGGRDGMVQRRDAATGAPRGTPLQLGSDVRTVSISPDSKLLLTGCGAGATQLWNLATGTPVTQPIHHSDEVRAAGFRSDGKVFLTLAGTIQLYSTATGQPVGKPWSPPSPAWTAVFSPDGKTILTGNNDRTAWLLEAETGKPRFGSLQNDSSVQAVAFSPDGKLLATGSANGTVHLWDAATGKLLGEPLPHTSSVGAIAFSPDSKTLATGSYYFTLWDVASRKLLGEPLPHGGRMASVAFRPDGQAILTGGERESARLYSLPPDLTARLVFRHKAPINSVAMSADGTIVLTAGFDEGRIWNAHTGALVAPLPHKNRVLGVAISPDGKLAATGSSDETVRLWDAATGQLCHELPLDGPLVHPEALAFSPDGRTLLTGTTRGTAQLWDVETGKPRGTPLSHWAGITAVTFNPNGSLVLTGSSDKTARLWDALTGLPFGKPLEHESAVMAVAFAPDGKTVLTGGYKMARRWDVATGQPLGQPLAHENTVRSLAVDRNGSLLVTGSFDFSARVWNAAGKAITEPLRHDDRVRSVALSPDGLTVLTGSFDRTARLWDAVTGKPIGPAFRHDKWVVNVSFSADGRTALTASEDHTARLWPVPAPVPDELERIILWVQTVTGLELGSDGVVRELDAAAWAQRHSQLQELGGPPLP